jgi:Tfp pilus assembly protein FimV
MAHFVLEVSLNEQLSIAGSIDSEFNIMKRNRIVGMALPKDAVSVEGARLKNNAIILMNSDKLDSQHTKYFRKNVFLSALLLSNFFVAEHAFALSVQPIQVKSALGEPFRAHLVISDIAGVDPSTIRASLASDNEFIQLGINKRNLANELHFSTAITSPERGVITITSDRPLNDPYIEFVVHIGFGRNVRLQQVTALVDPPLTRVKIDNLNLPIQKIELAEVSPTPAPPDVPQPTTTKNPNLVKLTSTVTSRTIQLIPSRNAPPPMVDETPVAQAPTTPKAVNTPLTPKTIAPPPMSSDVDNTPAAPLIAPIPIAPIPIAPTPIAPLPIAQTPRAAAPIATTPIAPSSIAPAPAQTTVSVQAVAPSQSSPVTTTAPVESATLNAPTPPNPVTAASAPDTPTPPAQTTATPIAEKPNQPAEKKDKLYTVQRHDSLWAIATRMQKDMNIPVTVIMHSIQQNNQSAFILGNPNHIRSGATIVLPNKQDIAESVQPIVQPIKTENDEIENNKTPTIRSLNQQANEAKTPYIRRGHLPDAKMTLVASAQEGNAQGSASEGQSDIKKRELSEINLKITTAHKQNMTLSQEVSELEAKIKENDRKLALQNAKLAELMQRLKNRKDAAHQNANRTQDHE